MGIYTFARQSKDPLSKRSLMELTIGDEEIEDDEDEFSINAEEDDDAPETPEEDVADDVPEEAQAAADTPENANDNTDDVDDDFSLPDDAGEDTDPADDTSEPNTGEEGDENDQVDDNFSINADGDTNDESGQGDTDTASEDTDAQTASGTDDSGQGNDDAESDELKQEEDKLYDTLTDDQKKIRILKLKIGFKDVYEQADSVLNAINDIPKTNENIDVIRRLIVVLDNVKKYLIDYMSYEFDKRTYLDNNQVYIKYINIFNIIKKTIDQLAKDQNS